MGAVPYQAPVCVCPTCQLCCGLSPCLSPPGMSVLGLALTGRSLQSPLVLRLGLAPARLSILVSFPTFCLGTIVRDCSWTHGNPGLETPQSPPPLCCLMLQRVTATPKDPRSWGRSVGLKLRSIGRQNTRPHPCMIPPWAWGELRALWTRGLVFLVPLWVESRGLCLSCGHQAWAVSSAPPCAVCLWASHCTSLHLNFPICEWAQRGLTLTSKEGGSPRLLPLVGSCSIIQSHP